MRRRLISTIRERRPENVARRTLTKRAPCSTYSTYSASSAGLLLFFVPQQKVALLHCTTLHNTALHSQLILLYILFWVSFLFRALLLTSPSSTSTSTSLLSASPQRGSCGMLGICFALCLTFCSYATPLRLPHSDPPRAASFSFPLPFSPHSLPLFFWM